MKYIETNICRYFYKGKCWLLEENCPSNVRYDDDNDNNVPCDLAYYNRIQNEGENLNKVQYPQ